MSVNTNNNATWFNQHKGLVVGIAIGVVVIVVAVCVLVWQNNVNNEGFRRQRDVVKQYNMYQTELSTCLDNTQISASVANQEYAQVKDILTSVVSARYVDANGQPTRASGALGGGQFISALQEQYPNIDRSLWKQLMSTAVGCRNQVAGVNNHLQQVAGDFDKWTNTGGVIERHIRNNWPNDQLKVIGLTGPITGRDALDFLTQPITTASATQAIRTHVMPSQGQDLFPSPGSTK